VSRPEVSVVMPFAGDAAAALAAAGVLSALETRPGDELILVDNSGTAASVQEGGVHVVHATAERSPAHARNAGAAVAHNDWILFLDADTLGRSELLDAYFEQPVGADVGALAGEVVAITGSDTLAGRYGAARSFLGQQAHLDHPYRPRAAAANLLVRREAFLQVGGFYEGVRAGEDTDFTWRLQQAGWRLELAPQAWVEHRYRTTLRELRRQWRGYAAGRAWLARRYEGFEPEPGLARALRRGTARLRHRSGVPRGAPRVQAGSGERGRYLALDALLSLEELAGLTLSNRPTRTAPAPAEVVVVADRFPARDDPLVELAATLERARVEAMRRPEALDVEAARRLEIEYREDDGIAARVGALLALFLRHPVRALRDLANAEPGQPRLSAIAPAVRRLQRDRGARVLALGGEQPQETARRIAALAGRPFGELPRHGRIASARKLQTRRR
jgi:GT2 family glycosyltransferase